MRQLKSVITRQWRRPRNRIRRAKSDRSGSIHLHLNGLPRRTGFQISAYKEGEFLA